MRIAGAILTCGLLCGGSQGSPAQDETVAKHQASPRLTNEAVEALVWEYQQAFAAWVQEVSQVQDPARRDRLMNDRPRKDDVASRLFRMVEADPAGEGAFGAVQWIYMEAEDDALRNRALRKLTTEYAEDARLGFVLPALERDGHARGRSTLESIAGQHPDPAVRGAAQMALASWLLRFDAARSRDRAESLLREVVAQHADDSWGPDGPLGPQAEARLFELRHLSVGAVAPDIVGTDLAGRTVRLSDYRGQVVLLPFWAHWCQGCMVQAEHEKSLLTEFADQPFVVLGVNADPDAADRVRAMNEARGIAWRNITNGGPRGGIMKKWNVQTLPTTYLIGPDGVILRRWVAGLAPPDELRAAVEEALASGD